MIFLYIFAVLTLSAYGQRTPSISWITKEMVVDIGSSVTLECAVQYASEYPVLWVKTATPGTQDLPISSNSALIVKNSRYHLNNDESSSMYRLDIRELQENDGGEYQCQVLIDISNRITASVELLVRRPPVISDNSTRSVVVSEESSVVLECYAGGVPLPKISWRRENNALLPTGGSVYSGNSLKIPSIRKEDRGTYYCIAENGVGRGARRNINVEVEFKPVVSTLKPVVYQALLYDSLLECRVESYPPAAITWVFKSENIVNNQHYTISQFATADEFTDTTLRVVSIEKRQYGNYSCTARNKLGYFESSIVLYESNTPICPPACGEYTSPAIPTTEDSIGTVEETTPCPCAQQSHHCEKETMEFSNLTLEGLSRILMVEKIELTRLQMKLAHKQIAQLKLEKHELLKRKRHT